MPIRIHPQKIIQLKEEKKVEEPKRIEVAPEPVNPMEELNSAVDELRDKLKGLLDETGQLARKVKEAAL